MIKKIITLLSIYFFQSHILYADWTDYLHNQDYKIGYGFVGHENPFVKTHPKISFRNGSYSTDAHLTCIEGDRLRTISKRKICLYEIDELVWDDEKDKKIKTGNRICGKTRRVVLSRPLKEVKEVCENRKKIIHQWQKDNPEIEYQDEQYPNCTLKRTLNINSITTFKVFIASKKKIKNSKKKYDSKWGGIPLSSEMWTIPQCY